MSTIPTHICVFLKNKGKHKEGDLVLLPGDLVEEFVGKGIVSIDPAVTGSDFSKLVDYKA